MRRSHVGAWLQLQRAIGALPGESLAAAPTVGGISDQAHLSRTMRRFFGVTPRTASRLVDAPGSMPAGNVMRFSGFS